jgi:hypothetical protein
MTHKRKSKEKDKKRAYKNIVIRKSRQMEERMRKLALM